MKSFVIQFLILTLMFLSLLIGIVMLKPVNQPFGRAEDPAAEALRPERIQWYSQTMTKDVWSFAR
jgi:hypothetical protein